MPKRGTTRGVLLLALLVMLPSHVLSRIPDGARLRVIDESSGEKVVGNLLPTEGGGIVRLRNEQGIEYEFAIDAIKSIEISKGHRGHTVEGLLVGTAVGAGVGAIIVKNKEPTGEYADVEVASIVIIGTLIGAGVGAGTGYFIKSEKWEHVLGNLEFELGVSGHGRAVVGVRLDF